MSDIVYVTLQHSATHSNTQQHPATPSNTLHTATYCPTHCKPALQHTNRCEIARRAEYRTPCVAVCCSVLQFTVGHGCCSVLQCAAVCCLRQFALRKILIFSKVSSPVDPQAIVTHINTQQHTATHCNTVCCSVLQCVAVCCGVLRCVAVCCSVQIRLKILTHKINTLQHTTTRRNTLQHTATPCIAACCSVLQCVAVCCSVLQCVDPS